MTNKAGETIQHFNPIAARRDIQITKKATKQYPNLISPNNNIVNANFHRTPYLPKQQQYSFLNNMRDATQNYSLI